MIVCVFDPSERFLTTTFHRWLVLKDPSELLSFSLPPRLVKYRLTLPRLVNYAPSACTSVRPLRKTIINAPGRLQPRTVDLVCLPEMIFTGSQCKRQSSRQHHSPSSKVTCSQMPGPFTRFWSNHDRDPRPSSVLSSRPASVAMLLLDTLNGYLRRKSKNLQRWMDWRWRGSAQIAQCCTGPMGNGLEDIERQTSSRPISLGRKPVSC